VYITPDPIFAQIPVATCTTPESDEAAQEAVE